MKNTTHKIISLLTAEVVEFSHKEGEEVNINNRKCFIRKEGSRFVVTDGETGARVSDGSTREEATVYAIFDFQTNPKAVDNLLKKLHSLNVVTPLNP
jgi:hypothetical protein